MPVNRFTDKEDVVDTHSGMLNFFFLNSVTKNEILPFIATQMDLVDIMLC